MKHTEPPAAISRHNAARHSWIATTAKTLFFIIGVAHFAQCYRQNLIFPHVPDFSMRYNEAQCIRQGIRPGDVASGEKKETGFVYLGTGRGDDREEGALIDSCYPPWEYSLMLPFALMKYNTALHAIRILNLLVFLAASAMFFLDGFRLRRFVSDGLLQPARHGL